MVQRFLLNLYPAFLRISLRCRHNKPLRQGDPKLTEVLGART